MQEFTVPSGLEVVDVGGGFFSHGERYYLRPDQRALLDQETATAPEQIIRRREKASLTDFSIFSADRIPLKSEFPVLVERGPTGLKGTAKIYCSPVISKGKRYPSYVVTYYNLRERRKERFNDYWTAYGAAEEKATQLSNGEVAAVGLKSSDQRLYASALQILEPLDISLESALREYVESKEILGKTSLLEAARFHARHASTITKKGTLREILDAMLTALEADHRSAYHIRDIRRQVGQFVDAFMPTPIEEITTSNINEWLRKLKMGTRSRDNYRNSVHNFFRYARSEGYLLKDRPTAADETKKVDEGGKENEVFTPDEMKSILTGIPERIIPTLVIKAFSGVRTEEMSFLTWEDIKWDQNVIIPKKQKTKTKGRRVIPLTPNLKVWLEPYRGEKGRIAARWKNAETMAKGWTNWIKKTAVPYKKNAMRNSYISYRVAETSDITGVAMECGTSAAVIQEDYLELVTKEAASLWFSIVPSDVTTGT
jgi:integrase